MIFQRGLVNMWRLLGRVFFIIIIFSFFGFGEDFEKVCNEEVLKEDFNVSVVKKSCFKTAQKYEEENNMDDASWYYLIADKQDKNIDYMKKLLPKDALVLYSNIGHSCLLTDNAVEGEKYYKKFLDTYHNPNFAMQNDFKELLKLYPKYRTKILKAKKIWNRLYKPFIEIDDLYAKLENLEQGKESILYLKKIIFIKEKYLKNSISIASDYQSLAIVFEDKFSKYKEALNLYNKVLTIFLEHLGEEYFDTATAYYNIANIYNTQGHYKKALKVYHRVLKIDLKIFGEEHSETGATYHNMGNVHANMGNFKKAFKLYNKSLTIHLRVLEDKEHKHITATYHEMANLLTFQGKYDEALTLYFKVLKIDLKRKASKQIEIATLYHNIANIFKDKGEYHKSLEYYEKSLKITMKLLGEHHASTITTQHNIAYVYHYLGNYDKALTIYMKVLEYDFIIFGLNHPHTATTYHHIAYIYQDKKMYSEALEIYNLALDIREKLLGKEHISTASTYHNIGNILEDLKKYNLALTEYNKALKTEINVLGKEHPTTINTYHNMANVFQAQKLYSKSLIYYTKALNANLKNLRKNHPTISTNYHNIGISHFYKKNYQEAYSSTKKSFDIFLSNREINIKALDSFEKKNYLKHSQDIIRLSHLFRTAWFYAKKSSKKEINNQTLNYWLNYKGTLFEYQNILSMIKHNPKTTQKVKETIQTLNELNIQRSKEEENKEVIEKIHTIEIELSQQNDTFRKLLELKEIDYQKISTKLKPHQLYIDFARGNDNYYIFTIDNNKNITFQQIDENETKNIDKNIKAYRDNTKNMAQFIKDEKVEVNLEKSKKEAKIILEKLYSLLVKKYLKEHIKNKKQLIISTDGKLNYFPFEALYSKGRYLVEDYTINYISSGKEFVRQTKLKPKEPKQEMILFANADFNAKLKAYAPHKNDSTLGPRFGNKNEVKSEKSFSSLGRGEIDVIKNYYANPLIFEHKNATIKALMEVNSSRILHLSTHGLFLKDKNILNPMKQSVLIFAGGNENLQQSTISALQLSALDLQHTELVVLSACQSGLGEIHNAEGIVGLPKALLQAGAKNVIMSLWTVSNRKTTQLMKHFYANISHQQNYNTALQNAKIQMIILHPYYWSAFILSGL